MAVDSLTEQERAVLDLEQRWWATAGGKESAITALGLSPVRHYQILNGLITTEKASAYAALTVSRLRRVSHRQCPRPLRWPREI